MKIGSLAGLAISSILVMACSEEPPGNGGNTEPSATDSVTDPVPPDPTDTTTTTTTTTTTPPTGVTNGVVDAFGTSQVFVQVGTAADGLDVPTDVAFNPLVPTELWTVNQATDSTVTFFDPGEPAQVAERRQDFDADHFMAEPSAIAFGQESGQEAVFATCHESRNTYNGAFSPNDFMGPVLWPSDLAVYAIVDGGLGSHIDMLHQSPNCMGIEWDHDNAFWVFDGSDETLVWYDFQDPHRIGADDHADGIVRRYTDLIVRRVPLVPSHLVLDRASGVLYVADTGNGRVLAIDPSTAQSVGDLFQPFETLEEYTEWIGATQTVLVGSGLTEPSGIALAGGVLFVSDHATGEIVAYDLAGTELDRIAVPDGPGIMGLEVGPDGKLWYVDGEHDLLVRIDPVP